MYLYMYACGFSIRFQWHGDGVSEKKSFGLKLLGKDKLFKDAPK